MPTARCKRAVGVWVGRLGIESKIAMGRRPFIRREQSSAFMGYADGLFYADGKYDGLPSSGSMPTGPTKNRRRRKRPSAHRRIPVVINRFAFCTAYQQYNTYAGACPTYGREMKLSTSAKFKSVPMLYRLFKILHRHYTFWHEHVLYIKCIYELE